MTRHPLHCECRSFESSSFEDAAVGDSRPFVITCPVAEGQQGALVALEAEHLAFVRIHGGNVMSVTALLSPEGDSQAVQYKVPAHDPLPPPPSRTNWTRFVPRPVLNGHVSSRPPLLPRFPATRA